MGKPQNERRVKDNEAMAMAKFLRTSPGKLNLVAAMIRGKKAGKALTDLEFSNRRIAQDVRKVLASAVANAENNHNLNVDNLVVAEAYVGKSVKMKRFSARARGRAAPIEKFFSRLTIVVREGDAVKTAAKKPAAKKAAPKKEASEKAAPKKKEAAKKPAAKKKAATKQDKE
ncbi:MAG TPA: 50S ribosomal protein L22 [Micavibrio sp.]|nr:50S ribosomal protein L22 [Micavibrio sp.]